MGKSILIGLVIFFAALVVGVGFYVQGPKFGNAPSGARLERIKASPHYIDGQFQNLELVTQVVEGSRFAAMWEFLFGKKKRLVPTESIPSVKTDLKSLDKNKDVVVWLGHSSYYMQLGGKRILIDPVFSAYASPVSFVNKAFAGTNPYTAEDIPEIDVLIMSHDHWDHLDYPTIMALKPRIKNIVCALGVGSFFEQWGFDENQIHEEDWFTEVPLEKDFTVYVLPAQHFSGRFLRQNQTEWASFAFVTPSHRVFYSGDGGYGQHFKEIGKMFGGFDLAIMEDGQYDKDWSRIHMMPEQTVQASEDVHAKAVLPAHAGKFALSKHSWDEPFKRLTVASRDKSYRLITPKLGELAEIGNEQQTFSHWWERVE